MPLASARLADELVQMILAPSLTVSPKQLRSSSTTTFGGNDAVSSASVLLVCKQWLRVAIPMLYETIIIRSTGQSHALAETLRHSPTFAKYVKRIRLEGAYAFIGDVLPQCTNLITFVLLLHIYSDAKVTSLCRSLPLINPVEFVLCDMAKDNAKVRKVFVALCGAISKWKRLNVFWYPYGIGQGTTEVDSGSDVERRDLLTEALTKSKSLREFVAPASQLRCAQWRRLASNSSVSFTFHHHPHLDEDVEQLQNYADAEKAENAQLADTLIKFIDLSETPSAPLPEPCPIDTSATSFKRLSFEVINDDVWSSIFGFAALPGCPNPPEVYSAGFHLTVEPKDMNETRKALSLTCRRFERLVRPLFFRFPLISSHYSLKLFTRRIRETPALGHRVRVLTFDIDTYAHPGIEKMLPSLLPHLTNLLHFDSWHQYARVRMTPEVLSILAEVAGGTLVTLAGFQLSEDIDPPQLAAFASFRKLRSLDSPSGGPYSQGGISLSPDSFANLRRLRVDGPGVLFDILCTLSLPALISVTFIWAPAGTIEKFLAASRPHIKEIMFVGVADFAKVLMLAPSLVHMDWGPLGSNGRYFESINMALNTKASHMKLEKFTIRKVANREGGEKQQNNAIESIFARLDLYKFPSMKEIHFPSYEWPVEERSIDRQLMPKKAIKVKQDHGVDILDGSGKPWRPRAQMPH